MIVNLGKRIKVASLIYNFERDADTPGKVTVSSRNKQVFELPGFSQDAESFIEAYRRCISEDIAYRTSEVENGKLNETE